jgi:hypothetical protein
MGEQTEEPQVGEDGWESHPAFAVIGADRTSTGSGVSGGGGAILFDSDVVHSNTVRVRIQTAKRKRDLNRDWVHSQQNLIEIEMSEAQWASFVSTMNSGDGVPCTLRWHGQTIPKLVHNPRLGLSIQETQQAAQKAFAGIKQAADALAALGSKAPAKERQAAFRNLQTAISNAEPNVVYASQTMVKHTEDVVQKARADIEAMVVAAAHHAGINPAMLTGSSLALSQGDTGPTS